MAPSFAGNRQNNASSLSLIPHYCRDNQYTVRSFVHTQLLYCRHALLSGSTAKARTTTDHLCICESFCSYLRSGISEKHPAWQSAHINSPRHIGFEEIFRIPQRLPLLAFLVLLEQELLSPRPAGVASRALVRRGRGEAWRGVMLLLGFLYVFEFCAARCRGTNASVRPLWGCCHLLCVTAAPALCM